MTADEMRAMANGLMPILVRAVADARAKDAATIAALEMRILEIETKPWVKSTPVDDASVGDVVDSAMGDLIKAIELEALKQL